eukprot:gene33288-40271_t
MAARRSSVGPGVASAKDLGDPFAIYTEVVNVGKTVESSKKKVKWLFGFSDSDDEYEVVLVHSLVSGKKTLFEDGKEITSSTSVMSTDFSHGWSSLRTRRMYRVEIQLQLTQEHTYIFSVDGVPYTQMPDKAVMRGRKKGATAMVGDGGRYSGELSAGTAAAAPTRRASVGPGGAGSSGNSSNNAPRPSFQSPPSKTTSAAGEFDPFAAPSEPFDPF